MSSKKVVVTGLGVLAPNGNTANEFWKNCLEGKSGVDRIRGFDPGEYPTQIAGELKNFDPLNYMDKKTIQRNDIFAHYCIAAVRQALEDSQLTGSKLEVMDKSRIGVIVGSGMGGIYTYS
ncbi:MAG TPA: beta-ketoacyl-[acyl-carrier-protein] synthase II, partial [Spirochaetes bacterium]|nr:beta-ketoacyl-[acyl-carrier-protein] synthase II [Spirochaetota bacterium]